MTRKQFERTTLNKVMTFEQYQMMNEYYLQSQRVPEHARVSLLNKYKSSKGANLLTRVIIDYIKMNGYHAERTNTQGQYRDGRWVKGRGTKGSSDVKAIIEGKFIAIEIKYGKDRLSEYQLKYQKNIENSGGRYIIAKHLNDIESLMKTL